MMICRFNLSRRFRLTRLVRGVTYQAQTNNQINALISTHTPRERRDWPATTTTGRTRISTHTPRERRDLYAVEGAYALLWISTHTPRERRDAQKRFILSQKRLFQLTRLVRGVTV